MDGLGKLRFWDY